MQDERPDDDVSTGSQADASGASSAPGASDPVSDDPSIVEAVEAHPETQEEVDQLLMKRLQSLQRPTWELELLISGAVVFSLFQVPERLRSWFESVSIHAGSDVSLLPFMAFYALTLVTICLAAAFSLHFVLRSIWVGITGLQSAFPKGIEWDKIDAGPVAEEVLKELNPSLEAAEDRLDAISSSIFAVLFAVVVSFVATFGVILVPAFVIELLRSRLFPQVPSIVAFYVVIGVLVIPAIPLQHIDGWFKKDRSRIDRHPRLYRFTYRTSKIVQTVFLGRLTTPVTLTLSSRFSLKRVSAGMVAAIFLAVGTFLAYFAVSMGLIGLDSYVFFPNERGPARVEARHYGDENVDGRRGAPRIQSEVIEGPFLRLVVPFSATREDERVTTHCPDVEFLRPEGLFIQRRPRNDTDGSLDSVVHCMKQIFVVAIDDRVLDVDWALHQDPVTSRKGVLGFLPVHELAAGRHELLVARRAATDARTVWMAPQDGRFRLVEEKASEENDGEGSADEPAAPPVDGALEIASRDRFQIPFWVPPRPFSEGPVANSSSETVPSMEAPSVP